MTTGPVFDELYEETDDKIYKDNKMVFRDSEV